MGEFRKMTKNELMEYILLNMKNCPFNLNRAEYEAKGWNFDAFFSSLVRTHAAKYKKEQLVNFAENVKNVSYGIKIY